MMSPGQQARLVQYLLREIHEARAHKAAEDCQECYDIVGRYALCAKIDVPDEPPLGPLPEPPPSSLPSISDVDDDLLPPIVDLVRGD